MIQLYVFTHGISATLSIGYFQGYKKKLILIRLSKKVVLKVSNWWPWRVTANKLTYSVIVPESHPNMPSTVTEAYRVISQGLLEGFKNLGFDTYFAVPKTPNKCQNLNNLEFVVRFDAPSWYEQVVEGQDCWECSNETKGRNPPTRFDFTRY